MYSKEDHFTISSAYMACDAVISNHYSSHDSSQDPELIKECDYLSEYFLFATYTDEKIRKTSITELSALISDYLTRKSTDKLNDLQLLLLSGHDTTLIPFISQFNTKNAECLLNEYKKIYIDGKQIEKSECILEEMNYTANLITELY